MSLPKTRVIGKKRYGLRQTTRKRPVAKKAVSTLRKQGTPARLVKSVDTRFGVYAGTPRPEKAPKKAVKRAGKRPIKRGTAKRHDAEFMPDNLLGSW